jgi:perosamine synthetase
LRTAVSSDGPTVGLKTSIRDAMASMTEGHLGLLPVIDEDGVLLGIVVDGDIRRGILRGIGLDSPVEVVTNFNPVKIESDAEQHVVEALMRKTNKVCIPVVDKDNKLVRLAISDRPLIPNCVPNVEGREQAYVAEAIAGGWLAVGPFIERFETKIGQSVGAKHAVAVVNGTSALHLALLVAGVKEGDIVITSTMTFSATANAIVYCGAIPMFFDVDAVSWGINVDQVETFIRTDCDARDGNLYDRQSGARIGAIMPVHMYGHPVDLDRLIAISDEFGVKLVEDAAEALGARYKGRMIGAPHHLSCFSFNGNKIITSGGGGMVTTNDDTLAKRLRYFASQAKDDAIEFVHGGIGYNYRMPNINAALGLAQAEKLGDYILRKKNFVLRYEKLLSEVPGVTIWRGADWAESSCWMVILKLEGKFAAGTVNNLRRFLFSRGIEARPVWTPLHRQKPFLSSYHKDITVAEELHQSCLCLPCSTNLTDEEIIYTSKQIIKYFSCFA